MFLFMNTSWHDPFSVACAIEETKEEVDLSASPRLPDLQRPFSSVSNNTVSFSPFPDPFSVSTSKNFLSQTTSACLLHKSSFKVVSKLPDPSVSRLDPFALDLDPFALVLDSFPLVSTHVCTSHAATPPPISSQSSISDTSSPPCQNTPSLSLRARQPAAGRNITHNPLRPRVAAIDRLFAWQTPHGITHDNFLHQTLPLELAEVAKTSIMGAWAPSTRSTYAAGLLRFNQFCDRWSIPESTRMPASYALLCAFIGEHKGTVSGKTIKSWLSGIRAFHLVNRAEWFGDDAWVRMARVSANKEGYRHKRPLRAPVSIEHLMALRRVILPSNPFHAAVWAVALVTFFGCRRLGETILSSTSAFNDKYHVLRSAQYDIHSSHMLAY